MTELLYAMDLKMWTDTTTTPIEGDMYDRSIYGGLYYRDRYYHSEDIDRPYVALKRESQCVGGAYTGVTGVNVVCCDIFEYAKFLEGFAKGEYGDGITVFTPNTCSLR